MSQFYRSFVGVFVLVSVSGSFARAQSDLSTTTGTISVEKTWYSNPSVAAGLKSYNDMGRADDFKNPAGRILKSKNEIYLGVKTEEGWSVYGMVVPTGKSYVDNRMDKFTQGDPSVSLAHPIFDNGVMKISGQFREYFPVSDFSTTNKTWQQAYYLMLGIKLPHRYDFFNVLTPRYFSQTGYSHGDPTFYTEDYTTLTRPLVSWLRVGIGQHAQIELHQADPTGMTLEIYPMADFIIDPHFFFGPRLYFPVAVQGNVYDAPKAATLSQAQAELYVQATL